MKFTYYDVLGVRRDATETEIKKAWRATASQLHTDRGGTDIQMALVNRAYETLKDDEARRRYDANLKAEERPRPPPGPTRTYSDPAPERGGDPPPADDPPGDRPGSEESDDSPDPDHPAGTTSEAMPTWWTEGLEDIPVAAVPAFNAYRDAYWVSLPIWLCIWALALALIAPSGWPVVLGVATLLVIAVPKQARRWIPAATILTAAAVVTAIFMIGTSFDRLDDGDAWYGGGVVVLLGGLLVVRYLRWRRAQVVELNAFVDTDTTFSFNVWGRPGEPIVDDPGARPYAVDPATAQATSDLLEPLLSIPGVKVLHGIPSPRHSDLIVDHLFVCGPRIALVESAAWPSGTYTIDQDGAVLRDGDLNTAPALQVGLAAREWRRYLNNARIEAFAVIHTADHHDRIHLDSSPSAGTGPHLVDVDTALDAIGAAIAPAAGTVDRTLFARLLEAPATTEA